MYETYEEFKKNIPKVLIKNLYFQNSKPYAKYRRYMERKIIQQVKEWLESIDFKVEQIDNNTLYGYYTTIKKKDIKVKFYYKETIKNIYKRFLIYVNGIRINIRGFYKYMKEDLKYIDKRNELLKKENKEVQISL